LDGWSVVTSTPMRQPSVRLATIGILVVVVACASPRTAEQTKPVSSGRSQISETPAAMQMCRLPVIAVYLAGDPPGGWLTLPTGTFQRDPSSSGVDGFNVVSWDDAVHRWVPAEAKSVSPDGESYFVASQDRLQIVNAATGATIHEISRTDVFPDAVVGFTSRGVYLQAVGMGPPPGLWLFSAATGQLTQISSATGFWEVADESNAWGVSNSGPATVRVLDLQSGVGRAVFISRHKGVSVAGYVGHRVLIVEGDDVTAPIVVSILGVDGSVQTVAEPHDWLRVRSFMDHLIIPTGYAQDGSSIWFFGHGFVLAEYDPANGLRQLNIQLPPLAPTGPSFEVSAVAGRCVTA
jgi:hypothetical protein